MNTRNEMENQIIDRSSCIFTAVLFVLSFLFIFYYSSEFLSSLFAALLTAALGFASYVTIRLAWLALKK